MAQMVFLFVAAIAYSDIVVGSVHQTALLHENVTIRCQILTNSSGQLSSAQNPIQFKWSFSPFNKSEWTVILQPSESRGTRQSNHVKYLRPVWTDLLIVSVDAKDVGTYTCSTPTGESESSDIYVLGKVRSVLTDKQGI